MKKKVAIYARVSTSKQGTVPQQIEDIKKMCHARGYIVVKTFADKDTGSNNSREQYQKMIEYARQGKCDIVAVWKLDRLGRNSRELVNCVGDFEDWNIDFFSFTENIDTTTAMGKAVFTIFAAIAELERENIIGRVRRGIEHAKEHGTKSGRPIGRPTVDRDAIRTALRLMDEPGVTPKQIQKRAPVSKGTYYKILKVKKAMRGGKELSGDWLKENQISSRLHQRILRSYQNLYSVEK